MSRNTYLRLGVYSVAGMIVVLTIALKASGSRDRLNGVIGAQLNLATNDKVMPYTAIFEEITYNAQKKTSAAAFHQTYALRSDGAMVLKLGLEADGFRQIIDPSGQKVRAYRGQKSTTRLSRPTIRRSAAARCIAGSGELEVSERAIDAYRGVVISTKTDDRSVETVYALDYGCAMLEQTMTFSGGESSTARLASFVAGEPDPSLFEHNGLREGPPSALDDQPLDVSKCPQSCQERYAKVLKARDASYFYNRARNELNQR